MKALLCAAPGKLEIVERPKPALEPGRALVRIARAGVCGTDLHIFEGTQPYFDYPRVIGHELAGHVADLGRRGAFHVGQQVAILPYIACGRCVACKRGKPNCCQTLNVIGVHSDGGMAEYVSVPLDNLVDAEGVGIDEAAMVEFLAIGAHAVRRGDVAAGQRALIVGAGPIGLACAIFAKLRGAEVCVLDRRADRRAFASRGLGVDHALAAGEGARAAMAELTKGDFYDCVFDCTGSAAAMMAGFAYVAHGGAYVLVSIVREAISFADPEFHRRETSLLGSRNATREDFEAALAALRLGRIPAGLLTHRATLAQAPERFAQWLDPASGVIKAMLEI